MANDKMKELADKFYADSAAAAGSDAMAHAKAGNTEWKEGNYLTAVKEMGAADLAAIKQAASHPGDYASRMADVTMDEVKLVAQGAKNLAIKGRVR